MNEVKPVMLRNQTMDFLKGIGIIYVVLGHTLVNPMHNFLYLFHMPLFYFISGYFYKEEYSYNPKQLIISRVRTLYIPFIKYGLVFLLLHNLFFKIYIYSDKVTYNSSNMKLYGAYDYIINLIHLITFGNKEQLLGAFWFFTVLFSINIAFCFLRFLLIKTIKVNINLWSAGIISFLFVVGSVLKFYNITLPRYIEGSLIALMIFFIGFLYKNYISHISINKWIAVISFSTLCFGTLYANIIYQVLILKIIAWLVFALAGIYLNLFIAQYDIMKNNNLINIIGQNTIVIIALHFLCFKIINLIQVMYYHYPLYMIASFPVIRGSNGWWIAYSFTGLFIPICLKLGFIRFTRFIRVNYY